MRYVCIGFICIVLYLKSHRKLCQSIHNIHLDQSQIMEKHNVFSLFKYNLYLLLDMPLTITYSQTWGIWLFERNR